ncbi:hypothetical protein CDAR_581981 [Caerostris darwini]|uniref:Uncharacterized protein n=1 Tax=Caerostris darwini TaxID=1538125 RepID=A0AAV4X8Y1_9ARAC|nr:hypothetical protein CDAR_581981 [Caerostris darwini]
MCAIFTCIFQITTSYPKSVANQNPLSTRSRGTSIVGKATELQRRQPQKTPRPNLIISVEIREKSENVVFKVKKTEAHPLEKGKKKERRKKNVVDFLLGVLKYRLRFANLG